MLEEDGLLATWDVGGEKGERKHKTRRNKGER
jgi:hypothetical protein